MEEDISHIAADSHDSENMPSTSKKPDSVEVDARDDFFDSLIEAEINASTTEENADAPEEMLVEDSLNLSEELKETSIEDSENRNASETPVTEIDVNDTDGHEAEELPDSVSKDDEFVKPKNVLCHFPLGRIKRIVKSDPEVPVISAESLFLISKSTELFLRWLGKEVHGYTIQQKKKTIQLRDLNMAISDNPALEFLDGALD